MRIAENVLSEFEEKSFERSKFYYPAITLLCIFICLAGLDIIIDFERFTWKGFDFDWLNLIMIILIPGTGLVLSIKKNKIGWFISTLYFSFISALSILTIVSEIIQNDSTDSVDLLTSRQLTILTITTLLSIFFQTKSLRANFQINGLVWIITIIISLCLAVALIIFG